MCAHGKAPRPAGSASLFLLCGVLQRLTASCTRRIFFNGVTAAAAANGRRIFNQPRTKIALCGWSTSHQITGCHDILATPDIWDKGLDRACAMFMWASGWVSRGKQTRSDCSVLDWCKEPVRGLLHIGLRNACITFIADVPVHPAFSSSYYYLFLIAHLHSE